MTVKEYCTNLPKLSISDLLDRIKEDGFSEHENIIISCMESMDKIIVNHSANFIDAINLK